MWSVSNRSRDKRERNKEQNRSKGNALDAGEMPVPTPSDTSPESMFTASLDSSTSPSPRLWNTMLVGFASTCEAVDGGDGSDDGRGGGVRGQG